MKSKRRRTPSKAVRLAAQVLHDLQAVAIRKRRAWQAVGRWLAKRAGLTERDFR